MEPTSSTENHPDLRMITVQVNRQNVHLSQHKVTGHEIKEAAIQQGVHIQMSFVLFRIEGAHQHLVKDGDEITVHDGEEFRCVAPDDNS